MGKILFLSDCFVLGKDYIKRFISFYYIYILYKEVVIFKICIFSYYKNGFNMFTIQGYKKRAEASNL